jgi:hypothetical protein
MQESGHFHFLEFLVVAEVAVGSQGRTSQLLHYWPEVIGTEDDRKWAD